MTTSLSGIEFEGRQGRTADGVHIEFFAVAVGGTGVTAGETVDPGWQKRDFDVAAEGVEQGMYRVGVSDSSLQEEASFGPYSQDAVLWPHVFLSLLQAPFPTLTIQR